MVRIAINGFGRIGRLAFRQVYDDSDIEVVAINDLTDTKTLAHLLKYDTAQGRFLDDRITYTEDDIVVDGKNIRVYKESDPEKLPWEELDVDVVLECTGFFTSKDKAMKHIIAGAKKVIISAPAGEDVKTIVYNVNHEELDGDEKIISAASCTTNCLAPVAKVLNDNFKIRTGFMSTIHAYTNDQRILDKSHKDLRRARAAGESMIPTTTGAAKAVAKVLPQLEGKLNGFAVRVPTPTVSLVDLVCILKKDATVEEVNAAFKNASETYMKGILGYSEEPLVSIDYRGDERSSIVDGLSTMSMGKRMFKIVSWYDNEWGYSSRTVDLIDYVAGKI